MYKNITQNINLKMFLMEYRCLGIFLLGRRFDVRRRSPLNLLLYKLVGLSETLDYQYEQK